MQQEKKQTKRPNDLLVSISIHKEVHRTAQDSILPLFKPSLSADSKSTVNNFEKPVFAIQVLGIWPPPDSRDSNSQSTTRTLKNNRQSFIHIGKERFFHLLPNEKLNTILKCIAKSFITRGQKLLSILYLNLCMLLLLAHKAALKLSRCFLVFLGEVGGKGLLIFSFFHNSTRL